MMDLGAKVKDFIKVSIGQKIDQSDAIILRRKTKKLKIAKGEVESSEDKIMERVRIRVIKNGVSSIISTSELDKKKIKSLVKESYLYLMYSKQHSDESLPEENEIGETRGKLNIFDESLVKRSNKEILRNLKKIEEAAYKFNSKIKHTQDCNYAYFIDEIYFANSYGFFSKYKTTKNSYYISVIGENGGGKSIGKYWSKNKFYKSLENPEFIGKKAAKKAIERFEAKKPEKGECPFVFDKYAASFIISIFSDIVKGENIFNDNSFLKGKKGKNIASKKINIYDNAAIKGLLNSRPFDGEGVYSRNNIIVEKGVLNKYLLNSYTANKLNLKTTGNASSSTDCYPFVEPSNFYLKPSNNDEKSIINLLKKAIYLTEISSLEKIEINTGEFLCKGKGFLVENGEKTFPLTDFLIEGNIKNLLLNIDEVSDNIDFNRFCIASPSFLVSKGIMIGGYK